MNSKEIEVKLKQAEEQSKKADFEEVERLCKEVLAQNLTPTLLGRHGLSDSFPTGEGRDEILIRSRALRLLAESLRLRGRVNEALPIAEEALTTAEQAADKEGAAKSMNTIANVYHALGSYGKTLEYYTKALAVYEELEEKSSIALVTGNVGIVYDSLGSYDKALEYYATALAVHEELGNKSLFARITGNIGGVYYSLGSYDKALEYYTTALATHEELGEKFGAAGVMGNIGLLYSSLGTYDKALEYYGKALAAHEELKDKSSVALVTGNIGIVYNNLGSYDMAMEYYGKALAANEELGMKRDAAIVIGNIGLLYANKKFEGYDPIKAEEIMLKTIATDEEIDAKHHLYHMHKSLADLYEQQERWKESKLYFEKYHNLEREVLSEEATLQAQLMEHRRKMEESERDRQIKLARFQEQEKILHNILPAQIADRMIDGEKTIADSHKHVSVFFSDIVGFAKLSQRVSAEELVGMLNGLFTEFDQLARKHGLEKIKTIGDAYMAVCGAPIPMENHAERTALFALDVAEMMNNYHTDSVGKISVRIGLHSGSVVAGIIGENKFAYDMWGDAVNTASRMESHGEAGKIHVSEEFKHAVETLQATSLEFIRRGEMDIKGKGMMKTYFLERANT